AYIRWLSENNGIGLLGPRYPAAVTYTARGRAAERVENSFAGYISAAYKANPVVYGVMKRRSSVFSEARFMWRKPVKGGRGTLFYADVLAFLNRPWPNGSSGELWPRMIQDVDLAGNFYARRDGDRLWRLRPDWVQIILSGDPISDPDIEVMGYVY